MCSATTNRDSFQKKLVEYDALVEQIVAALKNPSSPTHFSDIRALITRLEKLDAELSSSPVMREHIDRPDG